MSTFVIKGNQRLSGTIDVRAAKNSAVALLAASLMVRGRVRLSDIPRTVEIERMLEMFKSIGVAFAWEGKNVVLVDTATTLHLARIDKDFCEKSRASVLLFGALAAREKSYKVYKSGGCKLGDRSIRPHVYALNKFGIQIISTPRFYEVQNSPLHSAHVTMYEAGDTTTENTIMAAVLAQGVTTITFASANYMVQDLCYFLVKVGAKIRGIGTTTLTITGVKKLRSDMTYPVMPDPIEAMAWIALGITTHSPLTIANCPLSFLELELEKLRLMGQVFRVIGERFSANKKFFIGDIVLTPSRLVALPDKIHPQPFPGLNIDNLPLFAPILTQARGRTLLHDWVYENRAIYLMDLQKLGAKVMLLDPHRLFVEGPTALQANEIMCPPAIRPAVAILIAMLQAKGVSILRNAYPIERAHEDIEERLLAIGAHIEKKV